jgi:murein DD-endopeptidase MepM/ murein hydrolase activator NlpD
MKHSDKKRFTARLVRGTAALLATGFMVLCLSGTAMPVQAATQTELQQQLQAYEQKLQADKAALAAMKDNTAAAKQKKKNLESQIDTLKKQISVLASSISQVQNDIGEKEQEITAKEGEIEQKQADIDSQWADFKSRVAAMQEMRDCGTMAMLSTVKNLYQLLTFSEVLQDISNKDTEILDNMKNQKQELEQAKQDLEDAKAALEEQQQALQAQQATMKSKQSELSDDLVEAGTDLDEAKAAEAEAQAVLDSDQMNYEAVYSQIQQLVMGAVGNYSDLAFDGSFICPLASYTRISSYYGYRTLGGVTKLHPGLDYAAPAGTPIRAVASGYVTAAGWNSGGYGNYVLIYHGKMNDGENYSSLYGHMLQTPSVAAGQYVNQGDVIGYVGSTGNSTGNHLHIEIWQGSTAANSVANKATRVNPLSYLPG